MNQRIIHLHFIATLLAMAFVSPGAISATENGYCKWVDENGVVHYAEQCPDEIESEQIEIQPPPSEELVREARERSDALQSQVETRRNVKAEQRETQAEETARLTDRKSRRERCLEAMVDLHNLQEGEAVYFDESGKLHDQFSRHSEAYTGERTYIGDAEHQALINAKREIVESDCAQSRDEVIARIEWLAATSDSQTCTSLYERYLKENRFDRSTTIEELLSIEKTVLEICN